VAVFVVCFAMPLDRVWFRKEGGNLDCIKESQRRRFKDPQLIEEIVALDELWRRLNKDKDNIGKELNDLSDAIGKLKRSGGDATAQIAEVRTKKEDLAKVIEGIKQQEEEIKKKVNLVGNIVHDSVIVSKDEKKDNEVVAVWGTRTPTGRWNHHQLLWMIDGYEPDRGSAIAGHRAYFLKGPGVLLNQALINFGLKFSMERKYTPIQPPFFMNKEVMAETAQLEDFHEALFKVVGQENDEDKYLIATSEQPISAYHRKEWLKPEDLPLRYVGVSSCFRKEAGAYGKDSWGIFRVHQFEKIEQFCVTSPDTSWEMHEEMIKIAEDFYQQLGLAYRVVNIVSGELNNAAAKKYDLEAWFPTLGTYRELVSCSNCTDYQSRAMETRFGFRTMDQREKKYVHMLNATLCATERTICCILENYQTEDGVKVPPPLVPYVGTDFFKFVREAPPNKQEKEREKRANKEATEEGDKAKKGDKGDKGDKGKKETKEKVGAGAQAGEPARANEEKKVREQRTTEGRKQQKEKEQPKELQPKETKVDEGKDLKKVEEVKVEEKDKAEKK